MCGNGLNLLEIDANRRPEPDMSPSSEDEDHRKFARQGFSGRMSCRKIGMSEVFAGRCLNISSSGILFESGERVGLGKALEIHIEPESRITPPLTAYVEVVRFADCAAGRCQVACVIKGIRAA
jgi:hypothetical protein